MMNHLELKALICTVVIFTNPESVVAQSCADESSTLEAILCIEKKIDKVQTLQQDLSDALEQLDSFDDAVVAFKGDCPGGWKAYVNAQGRTIIGTGRGTHLTARLLGDIGGEEKHVLTVDEMPTHSHKAARHGNQSDDNRFSGRGSITHGFLSTEPEGKDRAHNTMPPWIALTYCENG